MFNTLASVLVYTITAWSGLTQNETHYVVVIPTMKECQAVEKELKARGLGNAICVEGEN